MADAKLYLRPIGFLYGDTAAKAVAEGVALPLAGGAIAFTAAELIEGTPRSGQAKARHRARPCPLARRRS